MLLSKNYIESQVCIALEEDLGKLGDITSQATVPQNQKSSAKVKLKQDAVPVSYTHLTLPTTPYV